MAYITTSFVASNGAEIFYRFKELLKSANWAVLKSSDGTTVYSTAGSTDGLTGYGTGAGGMNNSYCWIVLQMPSALNGYTRQIVIEKKSTSDANIWRVGYSVAGFDLTTGVTASVAPSSSDCREFSSNYDRYGQVFAAFGWTFGSAKRMLLAADNTAPSGFWIVGLDAVDPTNKNIMGGHMFLDPLQSGSYVVPTGGDGSTGDIDPYVLSGVYFNNQAALNVGFEYASMRTGADHPIYGWFKYGVSGQRMYPRWRPESFRTLNNYSNLVANPYNGKDVTAPVYWANDNTGNGYAAGSYSGNLVPTLGAQALMVKGVSSLLRVVAQSRAIGDTLSTGSGTRDRIVIRDFALPWDGSVPVI